MMRSARGLAIVLLGVAVAMPAYAQQSANSQDDIVVVGQGKGDQRVVCKTQASTGTRVADRNCKTVREWNVIREQHLRTAREMIDRPVIEIRR